MATKEKEGALKQRAYHELKEFLIIVVYLWVAFGLFIAYKSVILAEHGIDFAANGFALINALVLGKFMLIAKAFHPGDRANDAPLIYPALLKSAIFAAVICVCKILEDTAVGYFHGKSFSESIADLGGGTLRGILVLSVITFVMLIPLIGVGELQRVLPKGKLSQLFFRPRDTTKPFEPRTV